MYLRYPAKLDKTISRIHHFRLHILVAMVIVLSCTLVLRLAYLQLSEYKRYQLLSLKNQMNIIPIAPPRGIIVDRNGAVLADNIPVYVLEITPERIKNLQETLTKLKTLLPSISEEDIENFHHARKQNRAFIPIPLKLKLTQEDVALFASHQYQFPGVSIKARLMRFYPQREITAHLLGYVGRINLEELRQVDPSNYRATNFIGKTGIEKFYESLLHGKVGYQQVETDASNRALRVVNKQNPISGEKLYLTIDLRLQKIAYEAMNGKRGAIVAMQTQGGGILAMVSTPGYDPNIFVNGISNQDYQILATSKARPLYNRAVRGAYPPGSTIKPFLGLAGLEKGVIDAHYTIYDPGWFRLPGVSHPYRDWKRTGHGVINLKRAITVSCDPYFYQLGHKLGITAMYDMLRQFNFGQLTELDLHEEAAGIIPNKAWKLKTKGLPWYPGDTIITAIGQGFMLASPLQLANATAILSQKGKKYRPHLIQKSIQTDLNDTHLYHPIEKAPIQLKDPSYWDIVAEGMHAVITSDEGTGYRFGRNAPYSVAAKTGTTQLFGGQQYEKIRKIRYEDIPEHLRDHSLFIAFAPFENPEIAIAVLVENDVAASNVARKVLDAYFELKKT